MVLRRAAAAILAVSVGVGVLGCARPADPVELPSTTAARSGAPEPDPSPPPGSARPCEGALAIGGTRAAALPADLPDEVPLPALTLTGCRTAQLATGTTWLLTFALAGANPVRLFADQSAVLRYTGFTVTEQTAVGTQGGHGTYARGSLVVDLKVDQRTMLLEVLRASGQSRV